MSAGENQPTNVYTVEGFSDIKKILKPDGMLFVHYPAIFDGEEGIALKRTFKNAIKIYNYDFSEVTETTDLTLIYTK